MKVTMEMEDITRMVVGIDNNRGFLTELLQKIHDDMGHALLEGIANEPQDDRDKSLFLLLVQSYITGFLTSECDPPAEFTNAVRFYYAKGVAHGHAYLLTRREFQQ
jgi:hypothetical protein